MAQPVDTHPVAGVTIPLVTVLNARGEPDAEAARPLLTHLAAGGITRLMLAGTNGEGPVLPADAVRSYTVDVSELWPGCGPVRPPSPATARSHLLCTTGRRRRAAPALRRWCRPASAW